MTFGKQVLSSFLGSSLAMLVMGGVLIFIFVASLVAALVGAFSGSESESVDLELSPHSVLHVTLDQKIVKRGGGMMAFGLGLSQPMPLGLNQFKNALLRAADDSQIEGIFLQLSSIQAAPSTLEDLHDALLDFKESGKWIVAWSEMMGTSGLLLSSVADEVYLHPNGFLEFQGMRIETTFLKTMLERIGIGVTVIRGPDNAYKSAVEPLLRNSLSAENREQLTALLEGIWGMVEGHIAENRNLEPAEINRLADELSIRLAEDALEAGLVDGLLYEDELMALLSEKVAAVDTTATAASVDLVSLEWYTVEERFFGFSGSELESLIFNNEKDEFKTGDALGGEVAVIYAVGGIESGDGDAETIGSASLAEAIRQARLAPDVEAVVLRVNSPGGSALASDVIWRETKLLVESGKPLVVSMGDYAASGGYYISAAADAIYANATTITGSIGVFGVVPHARELLENTIGLRYDEIALHAHAGTGLNRPLDSVQIEAANEMVADIYDDFVSLVADGRGMTLEEVNKIARGRVWTGADALEAGLVDGIASLEEAIEDAALRAGLTDGYELVYLTKLQDPFEVIIEELMGVRFEGIDAAEFAAEALAALGLDQGAAEDLKLLRELLQSQERIQARMPYILRFE